MTMIEDNVVCPFNARVVGEPVEVTGLACRSWPRPLRHLHPWRPKLSRRSAKHRVARTAPGRLRMDRSLPGLARVAVRTLASRGQDGIATSGTNTERHGMRLAPQTERGASNRHFVTVFTSSDTNLRRVDSLAVQVAQCRRARADPGSNVR